MLVFHPGIGLWIAADYRRGVLVYRSAPTPDGPWSDLREAVQ